jgi:DNA-3-methyladenine glycosylase
MKRKVLPMSWFRRPAETVAEEAMGQWLCRRLESGQVLRSRITEVEAYIGPEDKAMHAYRGKTERNAIMFGPGGTWYVYLCYGMHWLINMVTGPAGHPEAVLIRGVEGITGPGRLTKAFEIGEAQKNKRITRSNGLWLEGGTPFPAEEILRTPRIGIGYAEEWVDAPLRWTLKP